MPFRLRPSLIALLLLLCALLAPGAIASPQAVIDDYNDNQSDLTIDKPHSWADLNQARSRFLGFGYSRAQNLAFSREIDRVIDERHLGLSSSDRVSGALSTATLPVWVAALGIGAILTIIAGIAARVVRHRRERPDGGPVTEG